MSNLKFVYTDLILVDSAVPEAKSMKSVVIVASAITVAACC